MNTAFIGEKFNEIVPYEAIEFVDDFTSSSGDSCLKVHMAESKKEMVIQGKSEVNRFIKGYKNFLLIKEALMGLHDEPEDDPELTTPTRKH